MLRQHSIPHIVQTAAGKFRLSGTGMLAVPSASFTPTSNLSLYMSARSFRIFGTAVHFYFDLSGKRAALASCPEKGGKSGNPMPLRFPSGYPQRFNILSGGAFPECTEGTSSRYRSGFTHSCPPFFTDSHHNKRTGVFTKPDRGTGTEPCSGRFVGWSYPERRLCRPLYSIPFRGVRGIRKLHAAHA